MVCLADSIKSRIVPTGRDASEQARRQKTHASNIHFVLGNELLQHEGDDAYHHLQWDYYENRGKSGSIKYDNYAFPFSVLHA